MRVLVDVSPPAGGARKVELRLDGAGGELLAEHGMRVVACRPGIAPAEANLPTEEPHASLARDEAAVDALVARLEEGGCEAGDVEAIGRYLFACLLGPEAWSAIVATAARRNRKVIELALAWAGDERDLNRLWWEAMHDGEDFLAVNAELSVAITRIVRDAEAPAPPTPVPAPARVLFAIGTGLQGDGIRPGAELIGLLRDAERGEGAIDPLLVEGVSIGRLAAECARFRPHVVHFVGHGRLDPELGLGQIEMQGEEGGDPDWIDAEKLLRALESGGLPRLVLLTGCDTAAAGEHMDSMAAELVKGGIPTAIGMAGKISDPVCRLFSRKFGQALNTGEPLVEAMTHGRRAGLLNQGKRAGDEPAWAFPSIYLAPSVPTNHAPVDTTATSKVLERVESYGLEQDPVFCGRLRLTSLFDRLLDGGDVLEALVAYCTDDERLGKTRLLHELAAKALRAGHVVVMIDDTGNERAQLPHTAAALARQMVDEMVRARQCCGLEVPTDGPVVRLLAQANGVAPPPADLSIDERASAVATFLSDCAQRGLEVDGRALRHALAEDLVKLIEDARACDDESLNENSRVVVVLGGIANWGDAAQLLCGEMLDPCGLGTREEHVPVFASCSIVDPVGYCVNQARLDLGGRSWIHFEELTPFEPGEDTLAYQWILLHPREKYKPNSQFVYTPAPGGEEPWDHFCEHAKGVPGKCDDDRFYSLANSLRKVKILARDRDEPALQAYMEQQRRQ